MGNYEFWKITEEQAEAIRNGDKTAYDKFFLENYSRIRAMARNYYYQKIAFNAFPGCSVDDLVTQAYVDLTLCNFESSRIITYFLKHRSFVYARLGGLSYVRRKSNEHLSLSIKAFWRSITLDKQFDEDSSRTFENCIIQPEAVDVDERVMLVMSVIAKYLTHKEREVITLYLGGCSKWQILHDCKITNYIVYLRKACKKVFENLTAVVNELASLGLYVRVPKVENFEFLDCAARQRLRVANQTPEERERRLASKRKYRQTHAEQIRAADRDYARRKRDERKAAANVTA